MTSHPISPHQNCRESREVPFYPKSDIWAGVRDEIICSVDVDGNMQFNPRELPRSPETRYVPPLRSLPYQIQRREDALPPVSAAPRREPLKRCDTNIVVLGKEISRLESENKALRKQMAAQEIVIRGFCKLHVSKGEHNPASAPREV